MNASETDIGLFDLEAARRLLVEKSGVRSLGFMRTITSSLLWCYYWRRYPRLRLIKKKITPDDPNGGGIFRPHRSIKAKDNLIATSTSDHDVSFICFPSNKEKLPMAADKLSLISSSGPPAENLR